MTKNEILTRLAESRERFLGVISNLSEEEMTRPGVVGEWSVKDILVHLTRWEAELVKLLWQAAQGVRPTTAHFSNIEVDETNQRWFEESRSRSLALALQDFHGVRKQTIRRVKDLPEKSLSDPGFFPWLNGHPLWEWIAGDSFEHESEHAEDVLRWRENRGGVEG
jgi:hypothetical protein